MCSRFWWVNVRERDHRGDQDVDGRVILRWILRKWEGVVGKTQLVKLTCTDVCCAGSQFAVSSSQLAVSSWQLAVSSLHFAVSS